MKLYYAELDAQVAKMTSQDKVIWGGPIFSVSGVEDDGGGDKLREADELSTAVPLLPDAIDLNPMIFATPHTCACDPGS
jgi:hypothetical protein